MLERNDNDQEAFSQWPTRLCFLIGIANAVRLLHAMHLVHSDLKCENVMVRQHDSTYTAVLGDFGSTCDDQSWDSQRGPVGTIRFMAPELLDLERSDSGKPMPTTLKVDVFSFSFIMWILVSDVVNLDPVSKAPVRKFKLNPWNHGSGTIADRAIKEDICRGKRPDWRSEKNSAWSTFYDLIEICWSQNPDERPDFEIIEEILEGLAVGCAFKAIRGSRGSQAESGAQTVVSRPQILWSNPELVATLTKTVNALKGKFECNWLEHLLINVKWETHLNRLKLRKLDLVEEDHLSDVDASLLKEALLHVSCSGLGQNRQVFEGKLAMWTLEGITALRDSQRCVHTSPEYICRIPISQP